MKKRRNTKKALLGSLTMMLLCFALLLGTTFAWFTDTVSSSSATIHSGNLNVELDYAVQPNDGNLVWYNATDTTVDLFGSALWEPGYTGVVYLRVRNTGSLAVKYNYSIDVTDNTLGTNRRGNKIDLTDFLKLKVVESNQKALDTNCPPVYPTREAAKAAFGDSLATYSYIGQGTQMVAPEGKGKMGTAFTGTERTLNVKGDTSNIIAVIIHMPDNVDDAANHNGNDVPSISLKVNLKATQAAAESDGFDNEYDSGAVLPANTTQTQSGEGQTNEGQSGEGQTS